MYDVDVKLDWVTGEPEWAKEYKHDLD